VRLTIGKAWGETGGLVSLILLGLHAKLAKLAKPADLCDSGLGVSIYVFPRVLASSRTIALQHPSEYQCLTAKGNGNSPAFSLYV
jgi:hypothetical protein